jgi:hypothetical protein
MRKIVDTAKKAQKAMSDWYDTEGILREDADLLVLFGHFAMLGLELHKLQTAPPKKCAQIVARSLVSAYQLGQANERANK